MKRWNLMLALLAGYVFVLLVSPVGATVLSDVSGLGFDSIVAFGDSLIWIAPAVTNIHQSISALYANGVKHLLVANVPNYGLGPSIIISGHCPNQFLPTNFFEEANFLLDLEG